MNDSKSSYKLRMVVPSNPESGDHGIIFPSWKSIAKLGGGAIAVPDSGRFVGGELQLSGIFYKRGYGDRVYALQEDRSQNIWYGCGNGLFCRSKIETNLLAPHRKAYPQLRNAVIDLAMDSLGWIWVATDGNGLWGIEPQRFLEGHMDGHVVSLLPGSRVNSVFVSERNEIWASTSNGAYVIKDAQDDRQRKYRKFTTEDGLPTNSINGVYAHGDTVYFASQKGVMVIRHGVDFDNTDSIPLFLNATLGEEQLPEKGVLELDYSSRDRDRLEFECLSCKDFHVVNYHFRIIVDGRSGSWRTTRTPSLQFPRLESGTYTLEVFAKDFDETRTRVQRRTFIIRPPWWRRGWFAILMILGFIGLIWAISAVRFNYLRRREARQSASATLRLQALQAQMSPHFVSNILVAVQGLIVEGRGDEAREYLSKFAELNRQYLEASHHKWVTLMEEIAMLKTYLELEKMRFGDRFEFEILLAEGVVDPTQKFPSRLLQPLAENAIHHGLAYLKSRGVLRIVVDQVRDGIVVVVDDNGIGRIASSRLLEKRKLNHLSRGTSLLQGMMRAVNDEGHMRLDLNTIDKVDANGHPSGTRVEVRLRRFGKTKKF